jgi:hypothetical protein
MLSLYQITEEVEQLVNELVASNGELTPELEEKQLLVQKMLLEKTDSVVGYARYLEDSIELVNRRKKEIAELEQQLERRLSRYKDYLKFCMQKMGQKKIETPFSKLSLGRPRLSVSVTNEELLDKKYFRIKKEVDKKLLGDDLANGVEVEGAYLRQGEESISVKMK